MTRDDAIYAFMFVRVGRPGQGAEADAERDQAGREGRLCAGVDTGLARSSSGIFAHIQSSCKYKDLS